MALVKKILEQESYDANFFFEIIKNCIGKDGVLWGMEVYERQIGNKVYVFINRGAYVKSGIIYFVDSKINGNEFIDSSLDITEHSDVLPELPGALVICSQSVPGSCGGVVFGSPYDALYSTYIPPYIGDGHVLTGKETVYLVETNSDPNNLEKEPVFKLTTSPQKGELIISIRKIDWLVRSDDDPLSSDVLVQPMDTLLDVIIPVPELDKIYRTSDDLDSCKFIFGDINDPTFSLTFE